MMSGMAHRAWDAIHERLPARWRTAPPTFDPANRLWSVTALGPNLGGRRGRPPATVTGEGPDELAALRDLAGRAPASGAHGSGARQRYRRWFAALREAPTRGPHSGRRDRAEPLARPTRGLPAASNPRVGTPGRRLPHPSSSCRSGRGPRSWRCRRGHRLPRAGRRGRWSGPVPGEGRVRSRGRRSRTARHGGRSLAWTGVPISGRRGHDGWHRCARAAGACCSGYPLRWSRHHRPCTASPADRRRAGWRGLFACGATPAEPPCSPRSPSSVIRASVSAPTAYRRGMPELVLPDRAIAELGALVAAR